MFLLLSLDPLIGTSVHAIIEVLQKIYSHIIHRHFMHCPDHNIRKRQVCPQSIMMLNEMVS